MTAIPIDISFAPGVSRDTTLFDTQTALDVLWCRFRNGRPRKMGGYQRITDNLSGVPRRIHIFYQGSQAIIHIGTTAGLQQVVIDYNGNFISSADRTPVSGFTPSANIGWTLDSIFDTNTGVVNLIAHATADSNAPYNLTQTVPFIGQITLTTVLVKFSDPGSYGGGAWTQPDVAGGIVCVQPYVFDYDAAGLVGWSAPNIPLYLGITGGSSGAGQARISSQKIMAGAPLRGGGVQQPSVLFWSLSEVITGTFVGSNAGYFAFSTISNSSSIISTKANIEYDGLHYWCGIDRFLVYNGTAQEVANPHNQDWFFNNLNWTYAGKVQAFKVPRYGEIWWLAPLFGATECSHAIIYNVREGTWYDTELPDGGRSCGAFAQGLRYPIMGGTAQNANGYKLWLHESGTDEVDGNVTNPVRSYFETPYMGGPRQQQPNDKGLSYQQLEPDFIQTGDMTVSIVGTANARSPVSNGTAVPLKAVPGVPQEQLVSFKEGHRLGSLHIESNVLGGSYICGKNLLHVEPAEARIVS